MSTTTSIVLPQASALEVDTSVIDTSEVTSSEDKKFLIEKGTNILQIVAKAALEVGRELVEVQERFKTPDNPQGKGLQKFYDSIGISNVMSGRWSNKYRAYCAYIEIFGENERIDFDRLNTKTVSRIWTLPEDYRNAFLADIAAGAPPSEATVLEVSRRPEVKLSKAEELLAAAIARKEAADERWEIVKADPEIPSQVDGVITPEYNVAKSDLNNQKIYIAKFEQQIADLKAEIEAEKLKTAEETEEKSRVETELQRLKFDDASQRAERIKRVGSSLTMSVPQTLGDIQKFFAEKDDYPEDVRNHLVEQATLLANYIGDHI